MLPEAIESFHSLLRPPAVASVRRQAYTRVPSANEVLEVSFDRRLQMAPTAESRIFNVSVSRHGCSRNL